MFAPRAPMTAFTKKGTVTTPSKLVVTVNSSARTSLPPACPSRDQRKAGLSSHERVMTKCTWVRAPSQFPKHTWTTEVFGSRRSSPLEIIGNIGNETIELIGGVTFSEIGRVREISGNRRRQTSRCSWDATLEVHHETARILRRRLHGKCM